jgi:hypothetical protein
MAVSKSALKLMKSLYWIILSAAQLYVCYLLFTTSRPIAGILWLIFGFMLIYIMYPVFFPAGDPGSSWPPYITACPDYLTLLSKNACVDFVGLNSAQLKKSDPANPPGPADTQYIFNPSGNMAQKAAKAQQYGLSWEGIA